MEPDQSEAEDFVVVKGKKIPVENGILEISDENVTSISEIKGLETLVNLKKLLLQHNKIKEIKGLENLTSLEFINLLLNPIPDEIFEEIGEEYERNGQKFVEYCRKKLPLRNN